MRLDYDFVVPRQIEATWAVLTDLERVAPCMPGAALTEVVGDDYHGTVRVKVGPVVAQYAGVARFRERDPDAHHAVLEAKGKERSGRGLASAVVTADLAGEGAQTRVKVGTELNLSGPLAQFGRGAITEISERLFAQFIERLKESMDVEAPPAAEEPPAPSAEPVVPAAAPTVEPVAAAAPTAPADLLRVAGVPILKRLVPLLVVVAVIVVVLAVWLS
jgi:carbon monoxide dehydrogenase subunit G